MPPRLTLPAGDFHAYLFDCDGTIVDSMPLHYIAWKAALAEWSCTFAEDLFYAWGGLPTATIIARLNAQRGLSMPVEDVARRKEDLYYEALPQLQGVPEVLEHIAAQHGRIPFAVVSGSTRESVDASLRTLQLLEAAPELGLEALAGQLRANATELSRHFHRDLGMTLVRYRTRLRLLRFIRAVDSGAGDLMTAAMAAGFGSYSQCHRTVHAELGCAPRQYFGSELREQIQLAYDE